MRRTLRYRSNISDVHKEDNSAWRIYSRRPFPVISSDIGGDSRNREKTLAPIISVKVFQERPTARSRNDRSIRFYRSIGGMIGNDELWNSLAIIVILTRNITSYLHYSRYIRFHYYCILYYIVTSANCTESEVKLRNSDSFMQEAYRVGIRAGGYTYTYARESSWLRSSFLRLFIKTHGFPT